MHSGRVHSLNPYTFVEIHRNLKNPWKYKEIHMNFKGLGFVSRVYHKFLDEIAFWEGGLHSGRWYCILGGCIL